MMRGCHLLYLSQHFNFFSEKGKQKIFWNLGLSNDLESKQEKVVKMLLGKIEKAICKSVGGSLLTGQLINLLDFAQEVLLKNLKNLIGWAACQSEV